MSNCKGLDSRSCSPTPFNLRLMPTETKTEKISQVVEDLVNRYVKEKEEQHNKNVPLVLKNVVQKFNGPHVVFKKPKNNTDIKELENNTDIKTPENNTIIKKPENNTDIIFTTRKPNETGVKIYRLKYVTESNRNKTGARFICKSVTSGKEGEEACNHYDNPPSRDPWLQAPGEFHEGGIIKIVIDSNEGEVRISFMDKNSNSWLHVLDYRIMKFEKNEEINIILSIYNDEDKLGWCGFEKID